MKKKTTAPPTHPKVDAFFERSNPWLEEMKELRAIALGTGLTEDFKWGWPCYTHEGSNVVLIHGFKAYCAYLLFKGALLADPKKILIQQTENVQAGRQIRFKNAGEIVKKKAILKDYLQRAIENERAGLKVPLKKAHEYEVPEELQRKLDENPALEKAFEALTPGRQRGYYFYISQAKQAKTREARVEKNVKRILAGKGLDD